LEIFNQHHHFAHCPRFDLELEKKAGDSEGLQLEIFESSTSGTKDHDVTKEEVSE
jgi:hypothetical protein